MNRHLTKEAHRYQINTYYDTQQAKIKNNDKILNTPIRMAKNQDTTPVVLRKSNSRISPLLLVGMQGGADKGEGSVAVSHQPNHELAAQPSNHIPGSSLT